MRDNSLYLSCSRMFVYILSFGLIFITLGCFSSEKKKEKVEIKPTEVVTVPDSSKSPKQTDLDLARMQVEIEELKQTIQKQKETIQILEKSLVLGISPELYIESQDSIDRDLAGINLDSDIGTDNDTDLTLLEETEKVKENPLASSNSSEFNPQLEQNDKDYETRSRYAKELYDSGSYGQAIVEYSDILKNYPNQANESKYWIGMCWYKLKEYSLSYKILSKYIKDDPGSSYVPTAKLTIANSWLEQGYFDKAMKEYKDIIKTYPKDQVSTIAKQQILNAGKNL